MSRLPVSLAVVVVLLAGCGGAEPAPSPPPSPTPPSAAGEQDGRSLGGDQRTDEPVSAARTFVRGYLDWRAQRVQADQVPRASVSLRRALAASRVTPAQQERRTVLQEIELVAEQGDTAQVNATLRNVDERLDYRLPLELAQRDGRWIVQRIPADD